MGSYLVRRFLLMALTLFGMSILIFVMLRLVPGDIADILVDAAGIADPKEKAKIAKELGLDRPIIEQYGQWIGGLTRGDLGFAYVSERPAIEEIAPRIPISAKLTPDGAVLLGDPGRAVRRHQRGAPEHDARLFPARAQSQRPVAALLLARPAGADGVRALVRHDPDLHQRAARLPAGGRAAGHPGRRGGLPKFGADHAAHALVHARGHAPGLHPHGALQGRLEHRR